MLGILRITAVLLLFGALSFAQNTSARPKAAVKPAPAEKAVPTAAPVVLATDAPSSELVETFLKRMYGYNENIDFHVAEISLSRPTGLFDVVAIVSTPQGQQQLHFYITPDKEHLIMGDMMPFGADPFAKNREILKQATGPSKGPEKSMSIVEFADLECPACKVAQPIMEKLQSDFPTVHFVFQSLPLEQLHPWASQAAAYLDCIQRSNNDDSWQFLQTVFIHQTEITSENVKAKLLNYVKLSGADPDKVSVCADSQMTKARIQKGIELARLLEVTGTPTIFISGRPIMNFAMKDYDAVKRLVQFELEQSGVTK